MTPFSKAPGSGAIRRNDFAALFCLFWGVFFLARGETMAMTKPTGPAMIAVSVACFVALIALPLLIRGILKRAAPGEDEYLRRLLGIAAASGFYLAVAVFLVWTPLSGSLLPDPSGPQVVGLMLSGAALGWFWARWRHAH